MFETKKMGQISLEIKKCCGCGACEAICPLGAIEMKDNEEGFLYPNIVVNKCIKCKMCINICPSVAYKMEK